MKTHPFIIPCLVALLACSGAVRLPAAHAQQYVPLNGPLILKFDDPLGGREKRQFGIFRDEGDSPNFQFIEEYADSLPVPGMDKTVGFNVLAYNVTGTGSYNGWYLKLGGADWTMYARGDLVLRLRRLDPAQDAIRRTVKLDRPDTPCASNIKVEVKIQREDGGISTIGLRQRFREQHAEEQAKNGYFDLRIPLAEFALDLKRAHELVLVFEEARLLPEEKRGALAIRAIVLTTEPTQPIDDLLNSEEN